MRRTFVLAVAMLGLIVSPAWASVFQASANSQPPYDTPAWVYFILPKYTGQELVKSITLDFTGRLQGWNYYDYYESDGLSVPSETVSFDVSLFSPALSRSIAVAHSSGEFIGGSIAPCTDPQCDFVLATAEFGTASIPFSGSVSVSSLDEFLFYGNVQFELRADYALDVWLGYAFLSATLTETVVTVPEPPTWATALMGLVALGAVRALGWTRRSQPTHA